jgi:hypothetical protein
MLYYYDDDCPQPSKHLNKNFNSQRSALQWAEKLRRNRKAENAILYTWEGEEPKVVHEWKE